MEEHDIAVRKDHLRMPLEGQPGKGRSGEKADMRKVVLIIPLSERVLINNGSGHDAQPPPLLQAGPQPFQFLLGIMQMLQNLGGGYEVVLPLQHRGDRFIKMVEERHAMAGFFKHPGERWLGTGAEIQAMAARSQVFLEGMNRRLKKRR